MALIRGRDSDLASPRENNLSRVDEFECLPLIRAIIVLYFFSKQERNILHVSNTLYVIPWEAMN
jgi:hypothetical protein